MNKNLVISLLIAVGMSGSIHAAAIMWSATVANGFSLANGAELPAGNLARLGVFSLSDSQITAAAAAGNIALLNGSFLEVGSARIGDGLGGIDGHFSTITDFADATPNRQMYYWIFFSTNNSSSSASVNSAVQMGIFKMDMAINPNWAIPVDPSSATLDLSDLTDSATNSTLRPGASILFGLFPNGTSSATLFPDFGLAPVPEPTTVGLLGVTALGFLARRRSK
jgi:PEP-CTERM motif